MATKNSRPKVVVFVKVPVAGRVKTRLGRAIGMAAAASLYRHMVAGLLRRLERDPRYEVILAVSPDHAVGTVVFSPHLRRIRQGPGDLGARMQRVFDGLPPGPAVIVGSDIPDLAARHVAAAFRALGRAQIVVGPADDGGYWLIGQRRAPRVHRLFDNVRWSSAHALADTLANVPAGVDAARLEVLTDLDEPEDLRRRQAAAAAQQ